MSTSDEQRRMEAEDPQPGVSTFDRNHPATWRRHDPMNRRVEQRWASLRLRQRAPLIEAGDKLTAMMLVEAAIALEHATFAEGVWEDRARNAENEMRKLRSELRNYTGDHHTINAARRGDPSGVQTPQTTSEGHLE